MSLSIEEEKPPSDYRKTWSDESPSIAQQQKALYQIEDDFLKVEDDFLKGSKLMLEQKFSNEETQQDFCDKSFFNLCSANKNMMNSEQCKMRTLFCKIDKFIKKNEKDDVTFSISEGEKFFIKQGVERAFKELSDDFVNFDPSVFVERFLTIIENSNVVFGNIRKRIIHEIPLLRLLSKDKLKTGFDPYEYSYFEYVDYLDEKKILTIKDESQSDVSQGIFDKMFDESLIKRICPDEGVDIVKNRIKQEISTFFVDDEDDDDDDAGLKVINWFTFGYLVDSGEENGKKRFRPYQYRIKYCADFYLEYKIKEVLMPDDDDLKPEDDEDKKFIIGNWDVSHITDMSYLFNGHNVTDFNENLGNWDVSNVTTMKWMFAKQEEFNQDLSKWNVENVKDMSYMFASASKFNQDLSSWKVSQVTNMDRMFYEASDFNQSLKKWGNKIKFTEDFSTRDMLERTSVPEGSVPDWVKNDK